MINGAAPLKVTNLVKDYDQSGKPLRAVNGASFEVKPGEIFGLLGPNGAGKTSIISCIVTLEEPTAGKVEVFGHDVRTEPKITKSLLGFVPQELIHHGYFDVKEILEFHSGYFGRRKNGELIDYLLQKLGLYEHRNKKVKQLSGGMKRRLLIAKALVHEPKMLLLDEPTAGVDIELRKSLWDFVFDLKKQGMSILLTTHYIQEAEELCDRVAILQKGEIKRVGPTQELIRELTKRQVQLVFTSEPAPISHPYLLSQNKNVLTFQVPSTMNLGSLLKELRFDATQLRDVQIREGSLEDVLFTVLGVEQ